MERCVRLSCPYHDIHLVQFAASAWNGAFGGSTLFYANYGDLADAADILMGFPMNLQDTRELTFGDFKSESASGALALRLSCTDGAGHCRLQLTLQKSANERVELCGPVEPAALDEFVKQMKSLNSSLVGSAVLPFA